MAKGQKKATTPLVQSNSILNYFKRTSDPPPPPRRQNHQITEYLPKKPRLDHSRGQGDDDDVVCITEIKSTRSDCLIIGEKSSTPSKSNHAATATVIRRESTTSISTIKFSKEVSTTVEHVDLWTETLPKFEPNQRRWSADATGQIRLREFFPGEDVELNQLRESIYVNMEQMLDLSINEHDQWDIRPELLQAIQANSPIEIDDKPDYKLDSFRTMMKDVLEDQFDAYLLTDQDWVTIENFTGLSQSAQRLYIRLYLRKHRWIRANKIKYPEVAADLGPYIQELIDKQLFSPCSDIDNLEEALQALDTEELRSCTKLLKAIRFNSTSRESAIDSILKHVRNADQSNKNFFKGAQGTEEVLLKRVKKLLGDKCLSINSSYSGLFSRIKYLYYPPQINEDENGVALSHEFYTQLRIDAGQGQPFPKYQINKITPVYENAHALIRFEEACRFEAQILQAVDRKKYQQILHTHLSRALELFKQNFHDNHFRPDKKLPRFLRNLTAGHVYTRCLTHLVPVLEAMKRFEEAIEILRLLLKNEVYCQHYRGRWFERLAIDLEAHRKQPLEAFKALDQALKDPEVVGSFRLTLYRRAQKLFQSLNKKSCTDDLDSPHCPDMELSKYKERIIHGHTLGKGVTSGYGRRNIFITLERDNIEMPGDPEGDGNGFHLSTTVVSVEEVARQHYLDNCGFTDGLHTESHIYHCLYQLFFWDQIYDDHIEDSFRTRFQTLPLDFIHPNFYERRKEQLDRRLNEIRTMDDDQLEAELDFAWSDHNGTRCLINWDQITLQQLKDIAICLGPRPIVAICDRLIRNFRIFRSGFPDLLVWNRSEKSALAIEVKGPGDSLSTKQLLWLDYFHEWGLKAEVCWVKAKSKGHK